MCQVVSANHRIDKRKKPPGFARGPGVLMRLNRRMGGARMVTRLGLMLGMAVHFKGFYTPVLSHAVNSPLAVDVTESHQNHSGHLPYA